MSEKNRVCPEYEAPPPYSKDVPPPYPKNVQAFQQPTVVVDGASTFHGGARFNEFAKPYIPPPPPGCLPNHLQQLQMERGQFEVVITNPRTFNQHFHGIVS
ncbi:uncharacterized protein LOC132733746 [Ruditapes philippinarum]|uniref:uncharacterized protein LOC132733746 n=1 Tax=Ruditapes philippinarum TaxID=129788 RepID=UPI00295AE783|nr:uncharacterized protein LOC132733746 [Ruditapes philippinarum]